MIYFILYHCESCPSIHRIHKIEWKFAESFNTGVGGGKEGEETRSGTEKRCSHNLQGGHPAWWSADNYSIFPTVNI